MKNLLKRGIQGPSKCILCINNSKSMYHIFMDREFVNGMDNVSQIHLFEGLVQLD
jgi:hypothetical protein